MEETKKSSQGGLPRPIHKRVNIYAHRGLKHTSLGSDLSREYLRAQGVVFCDAPLEADLFLTSKFPLSLGSFLRLLWVHGLSKPLFVYTHEPRFCTLTEPGPLRLWPYPEVHVMNLYTGDISLSNLRYFWAIQKEVPPLTSDHWQRRKNSRPIVGLATHIKRQAKQQLIIDGQNIDLGLRRQEFLLRGHERGFLDVYGRDWPKNISRESSREGGWHTKKREILAHYLFNVAIENTAWPYYCSEKIWDAIEGGCLPIYWGAGTSIYEDFPHDSFLDYSNYSGPDELLDHVERMEEGEYRERMERCIRAHNTVFKRLNPELEMKQTLDSFAARVWRIVTSRPDDAESSS